MKRIGFVVMLLLVCPLWAAGGQQSGGMKVSIQGGEHVQPRQPLTNESIMGLVKIGFSDETIVSMIEHEPGNYSLVAANLIALKQAGVSEEVIRAMLSKSADAHSPATVAPMSPAPAAPTAVTPIEPGLYAQLSDGTLRHIAGRPTNFIRTGSLLGSMATAGIHAARMNTQIAGERAYVTVAQSPIFYYRVAQGAQDQVVPGTLNLILTEMTVKPGRRQFELEAGGLMRHSQGISVRHQGNFDAEEVEPGLYRLRPDPLKSGQYAFFLFIGDPSRPAKGAALRGFIFDFQVE
jgi:hypothetical protein